MPGSLILLAVDGTSIDQPEETPQNLLNSISINRLHPTMSYWSSTGSDDENSNEALAFVLSHPVCLIRSIQIRPFKAWFQLNNPIYAPKRIRITLGGLQAYVDHMTGYQTFDETLARQKSFNTLKRPMMSTTTEKGQQMKQWQFEWKDGFGTWTSPEYVVLQEDRLQVFDLPQPIVCLGGYVRIDLLGRTQRQMLDDLYYSRLIF